jgi:hypothetical protein
MIHAETAPEFPTLLIFAGRVTALHWPAVSRHLPSTLKRYVPFAGLVEPPWAVGSPAL